MDAAAIAEKKSAALMSLFAALFLTALKMIVGLSTGSLGILAEAAHSALDLVAAGVTFFAIRISSQPADRKHSYGHGKAENLAALAETLLLLLTCGWIVHEAIDRLFFNPGEVRLSVWAFVVMLISIAIDFNRARMLSRVAKKHKSQALEADALHFSTDILSSAVVLLGLVAVWLAAFFAPEGFVHTALMNADSIAALIVAVIVGWVSLRLGAEALNVLLDSSDSGDFQKIETAVQSVPEVLRLKSLRLRQSGPVVFADMKIVLPAGSSLEFSHAVSEAVEKAVHAVLPEADLTIHYEPEELNSGLAASIHSLGLRHGLDVHGLEFYHAGGAEYINLHVAFEPETPLAEAHKQVHAFEDELRAQGLNVFSHIEPRRAASAAPTEADLNLPEAVKQEISAAIDEALAQEKLVSCCHNLLILDLGHEISLSFHCNLPGNISVAAAHEIVSRIERHLHNKVPRLGRITIHTDAIENPQITEGAQP